MLEKVSDLVMELGVLDEVDEQAGRNILSIGLLVIDIVTCPLVIFQKWNVTGGRMNIR